MNLEIRYNEWRLSYQVRDENQTEINYLQIHPQRKTTGVNDWKTKSQPLKKQHKYQTALVLKIKR